MRILYIIISCAILATALLWLGRFNYLKRRTAAILAALSMLVSGTLLLLAVLPGNSFYGPVITHGPRAASNDFFSNNLAASQTTKPRIALTFDDGPYPPYTQDLLKVLAAKNVHATFFMVGDNAAHYPDVVQAVQAGGHEIALHAGYHVDLLKLGTQEAQANITYGRHTLERITGQQIKYMRPPHGFKDWHVLQIMQHENLQAVNWNIIPRDWTNPGVEVIADRVCSEAKPDAIVLLHDGDSPKNKASREQTIAAVSLIIDRLRAQGYEFVTIDQLINEK